MVAWLASRSQHGRLTLRIEDIDTPRIKKESENRIKEDLIWLGFDWDDEVHQSQRFDRYENALKTLKEKDLVYYCDCSRTEIAQIASAPHQGEEGPIYPGLCRSYGLTQRSFKRPPSIRFKVPEQTSITFNDLIRGEISQQVDQTVGDFVLQRGDRVYSYQLAVVVDDGEMGINQVVRGGDLLYSTPRQIMLLKSLDLPIPNYAHSALLVGPNYERLAKRKAGVAIRDHRTAGTPATEIIGKLAHLIGIIDSPTPCTLNELIPLFSFAKLKSQPNEIIAEP